MKQLLNFRCTLTFLWITTALSFAQDTQTLTGTFQNDNSSTTSCSCNSPGLLNYTGRDKMQHTIKLCFDTEPGSFYEIFDGETITLSGSTKKITCEDGKEYEIFYVDHSIMDVMNRREIVPDFVKTGKITQKDPEETPSEETTDIETITGSYVPKGRTMDDWSAFKNCKACGRFSDQKNLVINFDRISTSPDDLGVEIQVWGTRELGNFYVTEWKVISE